MRGVAFYSINSRNEHLINPSTINENFVIAPCRDFEMLFPNNIKSEDFKHVHQLYHIYQVRDPRDTLVSQYYSMGWTHPTNPTDPQGFNKVREWVQTHTIDEYVLNEAPNLKSRLDHLVNRLDNLNANEYVVKYEDMVLNFESWIEQVLKPFTNTPIGIKKRLYKRFENQFHAVPEQLVHKRKMIPGDYKEKLKVETINYLNQLFQKELALLGYN